MQVEVPDAHVQNLYNAKLHHFLISLTKDTKRGEYYPNTATFSYGTIGSESNPIIQALDMRGMHWLAELCLRPFLSTQGDAVPDGEYNSKEGGFYHYWPWYTIDQGFVLWALAEPYSLYARQSLANKNSTAILEAAGGVAINPDARGGMDASHYVGTCKTGTDPSHSVLNRYCQSHEVKNLFVVDGSGFPYYPEKNPTETVIALAMRGAAHLANALRKGNI